MISRWQVRKRQKGDDLLEHLIASRGLSSDLIVPDYMRHLHDPFLLPDMDKAVELVIEARDRNWRLTIFGDYDADGTPAAALLSLVMKKLGIKHQVILPKRSSGYGLTSQLVEKISQESDLLMTVDNGVTAVEEVALAKRRGLKVIIIDHHLPLFKLPAADALIDPYLASSQYPFAPLCGCALAFKLALAISQKLPELDETFCKWLLDLVAISTVADMMPLIGENRALVHFGLEVIKRNRRPGLRRLMARAKLNVDNVNARSLGFTVGPRLNASGRLGDNHPALELLLSEDPTEADRLAEYLEQNNRQRIDLVNEAVLSAEKLLFEQNRAEDFFYLIQQPDCPVGVVGLVAGKLAHKYNRPVIVGSIDGKSVRASSRSIAAFNVVEALDRQKKLLLKYGGHAQAAGLTVAKEAWIDFCQAMKAEAKSKLSPVDLEKVIVADALLQADELKIDLAKSINALEPFGLGNSEPLFILDKVSITDFRPVGASGDHLKFSFDYQGRELSGIGFNLAKKFITDNERELSLLGKLEINTWQDRENLQFNLFDYQKVPAKIELITDGQS